MLEIMRRSLVHWVKAFGLIGDQFAGFSDSHLVGDGASSPSERQRLVEVVSADA